MQDPSKPLVQGAAFMSEPKTDTIASALGKAIERLPMESVFGKLERFEEPAYELPVLYGERDQHVHIHVHVHVHTEGETDGNGPSDA